MKRAPAFLFILALLVLVLNACAPTIHETKSQFCNDLNELDAAVNSLRSVNSLDDLKQASEDVREAWDHVVESGEALEEVQLDAAIEAYDQMVRTIEDAPSSGTLSGALETIDEAVTTFATSMKEIYTTVCGAE